MDSSARRAVTHQGSGSLRASGRRRLTANLVRAGLLTALVLVTAVTGPLHASAATPETVDLGTASSYSVLAGSTVTNTGATVVDGDLGLFPGTAVTGFPPGEVLGTVHTADVPALLAKAALATAYDDAAARTPDAVVPAELGGSEQGPGVYRLTSSAQLTGTLTLDGQDDPNSVFIFQIGSTLTTATRSRVSLVNGAQSCNVFFQVGSSATLGTETDFAGTIMALTSITATTGATIEGRTLARNGAVTLDTNTFTPAVCDTPTDLQLTTSDAATRFGAPVTLTATASPGTPTGPVTFTDTPSSGPDSGTPQTLGTSPLVNGIASLTVAMPAFGLNTITASYGGDDTHGAATSNPVTVEVSAFAGELIISEFRSSGPAGADDSYVELLNTGPPIPLAGFDVTSSSGSTVTLAPTAPTVGTGRSYLVADSTFSLGSVAEPDAVGDLGTGGLHVMAPDTADTVTDAVGPDSGYHLGTGLPALTGTPVVDHAWVRAVVAGRAVDSRDNDSDFRLVSTTAGVIGGVQSMLGSASPTGSADPYQRNAQLPSQLLDPTVSAAAEPNRVSSPGRLVVRRTITNTSNATMVEAKIRLTSLSQANGAPRPGGTQPASRAALRVVAPSTPTEVVTLPGGGSTTVVNLRSDAPSVVLGGGMNSTLSLPLAGGLPPGASIAVSITFAVDTGGTFWFGYDVDATVGTGTVLANRAARPGISKVSTQRSTEQESSTVPVPADSGRLR